MTKRAIIIDTDPGLDDAVAILFALTCGHFNVRGLTSVAGNIGIDNATRNACRLLAAMDRSDIPVVIGANAPIRRKAIDMVDVHGQDGVHGLSLPEPKADALPGAVDWMAQLLLSEPKGTVDILALAPLTNIAHLIQRHPDAVDRIGRLIVMGGAVDEPGNVGARSEFNFATDPEATDIVFRAGLDLTIIPLDVTRLVRATPVHVQAMRGTTAGNIAADVIDLYFGNGRESRPLHDPCVMLYAVRPDLFGIEARELAVDLGEGPDGGALMPAIPGSPSQKYALRVDAEAALDLLIRGLAGRV